MTNRDLFEATLAKVRACVQRHKPKPPEPRPCPHCGSLECGPIRCRFTMESNMREVPGDKLVVHAAVLASVVMAVLMIGGFA